MINTLNLEHPDWFPYVARAYLSYLSRPIPQTNDFLTTPTEEPYEWITQKHIDDAYEHEKPKIASTVEAEYRQITKKIVTKAMTSPTAGVGGSYVGVLLAIIAGMYDKSSFAEGYDSWWDKTVEFVNVFNTAHRLGLVPENFYDSTEAGATTLHGNLVTIISAI